MKKSLFLLLFANVYLFSSNPTPIFPGKTLYDAISAIGYDVQGKYLDYFDEHGALTDKAIDFMRPFLDDQNSLKPNVLKALIHDICSKNENLKRLTKDIKTPNLFKTVGLVFTSGTKYQRAGMLFVGVCAVCGVVTACLNVKKKLFNKENNS